MSVHFSSQRLDWQTPKAVYQVLDAEFNFDYDPCPPNPDFNGLAAKWGKSNFVNPPYGNQIPKWIEKGYIEHKENGSTVVFLIPSRPNPILSSFQDAREENLSSEWHIHRI